MKRYSNFLILLLLVACTANQTQGNSTTTLEPMVIESAEPTDFQLATATAIPAPTSSTQEPINDDILEPTRTVTALTPESAEIPSVQPGGHIYVLWDPAIPIQIDGPSEPNLVNLYQLIPDLSTSAWIAQPLLTDLHISPFVFPSPTGTRVALLVLEDIDNNGYYALAGTDDHYRIYIYDTMTRVLNQIENQENLYSLSWLPDEESIVYPQKTNLFVASTSDLTQENLTGNSTTLVEGEPYNHINKLVGSPNGQFLALNMTFGFGEENSVWATTSDNLCLFDMNNQNLKVIASGIGHTGIKLSWSPDNRWLAFTHEFGLGLYVVNMETFNVTTLSTEQESIYYFSWSPDSQWLAFTQSSQLFLWETQTQTSHQILDGQYISEPSWSGDSASLGVGYIASDSEWMGLLFIQQEDQQVQEYALNMVTNKLVWSPDNEWVLFYSAQEGRNGLYILNWVNGSHYLIMDTAGFVEPAFFTWLP